MVLHRSIIEKSYLPLQKCKCLKPPICGYCGENLRPGTPCLRTFCTPCNDDSHTSFSQTCPKFLPEKEINNLSVDKNISYFAAKAQFDKQKSTTNTSFASVVQTNKSCTSCEELKQTVQYLTKQIVALTSKIESLTPADKHVEKNEIAISGPKPSTSTPIKPIIRSSCLTLPVTILEMGSNNPSNSSEDEVPLVFRFPEENKKVKKKGNKKSVT